MGIELSRRAFLAGTGALGASAAIAGLAGCSPAPSTPNAASGSSAEGSQPASSKLEAVSEDRVAATEDADIVVVGSGSAGTYAAVRAAELGAKVVWLEKTSMKGGTSNVTEGLSAPNTKEQLDSEGETDTQALFESMMGWHNWGAYAPGIWSYLDHAGTAIDWAIGHGARLAHAGGGFYSCLDESGSWINMGKGMLTPLWEYGESLDNLDFRIETPTVNLALDDGAVAGVYAKSTDGSIVRINAKAVILATGGFGKNPEMCAERLRVPSERVTFLGFDGQEGDGINMALEAGGASQAPAAVMYGLSKVVGDSWDGILTIFLQWPPSWRAPQPIGRTLPMVNETGKRFYNETLTEDADTSRLNVAIASQAAAFTVFDENHVTAYSTFDEFDYLSGISHGNFRELAEKSDAVCKADTLEELAELMGVDADALVATIEDYNGRANGDGTHDPFGADAANMTPIQQAPFYAAKVEACAYSTCGGVRSNYDMQVVDETNAPIEGLYATGLDNGSMYYNDYPYGLHGGTGQANACTSGYVAGEAACKALGLL